MSESIPIFSIINTAFYDANEPEILAIAQSQLVEEWNPQPVRLINCVLVQGADLTQMNTLPDIVLPAPRLPDELDAAYKIRTAAINTANIAKVKSASPHVCFLLSSISDFHLISRQDPTLIPAAEI